MKIAAYQFPVTGSIPDNLSVIRAAVKQAIEHPELDFPPGESVEMMLAEIGFTEVERIRLLVFPECALTGYTPRDISSSSDVDFSAVDDALDEIQRLADEYDIYMIVGSITKENGLIYNSAVIFSPGLPRRAYHKRALWGYDRNNFTQPNDTDDNGVFEIDNLRVGVRICYEVRFPEYFRELYMERTDLNVVLFYDLSHAPSRSRYEAIRAHLVTRAAENACYTLSVNSCADYQTAPTVALDRSGVTITELEPGREGMLISHAYRTDPDFGVLGRLEISDRLTGRNKAE